ncbi:MULTISPECIES: 50S ribosome-binding protein YggL [Pseudomonas]|uniref:50S ribosome-binding protein YggL n=1 Tax=Pseudomonas TaxID=286 RepID=UPI000C146246|nr:50S ribosome-binding protein YggL [Pseudomonas putida]MCL8306744.1 50S ribosome-binding protein YggL [Pseudomonas putida]
MRSRQKWQDCQISQTQELGFELNLEFKEDLSDEAIDAFLDAFLAEAMDANGLDYVGGDDFGLVCLAKRGSVSEEQRAIVEAWLKGRSELTNIELSPLLDAWYPDKPINTQAS